MKTKTKKTAATTDNIKVQATDKDAREGSFSNIVQELAHKPIMLETLIQQQPRKWASRCGASKIPPQWCALALGTGLSSAGLKL